MSRLALLSILALFAATSFAQTEAAADPATTEGSQAPADPATTTAETPAQPAAQPDATTTTDAATQAAIAAIASVQAQQQMSGKYAKLILDYHAASGWMQVAEHWMAISKEEDSKDLEEARNLEDDDEDFVPLGGFGAHVHSEDSRSHERAAEQALLGLLKVMYLQASNKLHAAHQSHYQTKIQLMLLQAAGGNALSSVMYLMYYLETLKLMSSAVTIQRLDAWQQWVTHDILETDMIGPISSKFNMVLKKGRESSMQLYFTEASLDLQIFYLEYYLQMMMAQMQAPQMMSKNAASFLEEESSAEPNSNSMFPFMMFGGGMGGNYMSYYFQMLRFYTVTMNYNAAQGLYLSAQADSHISEQQAQSSRTYALYNLQQWAYLKLQQTMLDMYGMFGMMQGGQPGFHHATANNNAFVQTQQPLSSPENVPSIENAKSL